MKRRVCAVIAVILVIFSLAVFAYPGISKSENQKNNDELTDRFDRISDDVQDGSHEDAVENGKINDDRYLIDDDGQVISQTIRRQRCV